MNETETVKKLPEIPPVEFGAPTQEGRDLFIEASQAILRLEKFLRKREINSTVCAPLYYMRCGIHELLNHYVANRSVCDKQTKYDANAAIKDDVI